MTFASGENYIRLQEYMNVLCIMKEYMYIGKLVMFLIHTCT